MGAVFGGEGGGVAVPVACFPHPRRFDILEQASDGLMLADGRSQKA